MLVLIYSWPSCYEQLISKLPSIATVTRKEGHQAKRLFFATYSVTLRFDSNIAVLIGNTTSLLPSLCVSHTHTRTQSLRLLVRQCGCAWWRTLGYSLDHCSTSSISSTASSPTRETSLPIQRWNHNWWGCMHATLNEAHHVYGVDA